MTAWSAPPGSVTFAEPLTSERLAELDAILLTPNGHTSLLPAKDLRALPPGELRVWMHMRARYVFVTTELRDWLDQYLGPDRATIIEVGAGAGDLSFWAKLTATDSKIQATPAMRAIYDAAGQPPVIYSSNVNKLDAIAACKRYKPHTVVASWVTQITRWQDKPGNGCAFGVDENHLLRLCKRYVFVGNLRPHGAKRILKEPHQEVRLDGIVSRGDPNLDRIWIWER